MFIDVKGVVYAADPDDRHALALLSSVRAGGLLPRYVTIVLSIGGLCLMPGLVMALVGVFLTKTWQVATLCFATMPLCAILMYSVGKAALNIVRGRQQRVFDRYVTSLRILQLPSAVSDKLQELAEQASCEAYLSFYRPDPYDLSDLRRLVENDRQGLGSQRYMDKTVVPTLRRLVVKIRQAQEEAEEPAQYRAQTEDELPRPSIHNPKED